MLQYEQKWSFFHCIQSKEKSVQIFLELLSDLGLPKQGAQNEVFVKIWMLIREHVPLGVTDEFLKNVYAKGRQRPMSKELFGLGSIRSMGPCESL